MSEYTGLVYSSAIKKNCKSNSQVIAQGKTEYNFDCYEYNIIIL